MKTRFKITGLTAGVALLGAVGFAAPAMAAEQPAADAYAAEVSAFTADNPEPVVTADPGTAEFEAQTDALYTYWQAAPWDAVWGQWGYSATNVEVSQQTGADGVVRPVVSAVVRSPDGAAPISAPSVAAKGTADGVAPQAVVSPQASDSGSTWDGDATLDNPGTGTLTGTWTNRRDADVASSANIVIGYPGAANTVDVLGQSGIRSTNFGETIVTTAGGITQNAQFALAATNADVSVYLDTPFVTDGFI